MCVSPFIIGPESHHLSTLVTHSILVDLTDVTNANSKLVDVVTFADVDAEDNSVVQIMKFGRITRPKFWLSF